MIRAIIFDCFGVMATSFSEALYERFPAHIDEIHDLFAQADFGHIGDAELLRKLGEITGKTPDEIHDFFAAAENGVVRNEALLDYILQLRKTYKIGVLSNIAHGMFNRFFDEKRRADLFDEIVLSSDYHITKPDPRIYEIIAKKLDTEPGECVFVDDRIDNCDSARAVGMQAVRYDNLSQFQTDLTAILGYENA